MKIYISFTIAILLFSLCLSPPSDAGYLEDAWVRHYLAQLGQSREAAVKAYLEMELLGRPQEERARLSGYLQVPQKEEALRWAHSVLVPDATPDWDTAIAAWIVGKNETPEKPVPQVLNESGIELKRSLDEGIQRVEAASYPRFALPEEHQPLIEKGLRDELLPEEQKQLKALLTALLEKDLAEQEEAQQLLFFYANLAYVHASGDLDYLEQLWQSGSESLQHLAFQMGFFSRDETLVRKCLEFVQPFKARGEMPPSVRPLFLGFLKAHKDLSVISSETRDWFERRMDKLTPNRVGRLGLIQLLGEDGWSGEDQLRNQALLRRYVEIERIHLEAAEQSLRQIEKRLEGSAGGNHAPGTDCPPGEK